MRTIEKTTKKVVIEITMDEILKRGFDALWDDIRVIYPVGEYEIGSVEEVQKKLLVRVELKCMKNN
jgi:hypothetical protein